MVKINDGQKDREQEKNDALVKTSAQRDMVMEELKTLYPEIVDIIDHGPHGPRGLYIIKKCLMFCCGEIQRHLQEFGEFQDIE